MSNNLTSSNVNKEISNIDNINNKSRTVNSNDYDGNKRKILVLISGSGTNLQALIDEFYGYRNETVSECFDTDNDIKDEICLVVASKKEAYGLERAKKFNIPTKIHELKKYYENIPIENKKERKEARKKFNIDLAKIVIEASPDLIVCAGWMLILGIEFLTEISKHNIPIINLHPALPGQFDGINAIERAWKAAKDGEIQKSGVMVHYVIKEVDRGEPIVVKEITIGDSSLEEYEDRVHSLEHEAIVEGTLEALRRLSK